MSFSFWALNLKGMSGLLSGVFRCCGQVEVSVFCAVLLLDVKFFFFFFFCMAAILLVGKVQQRQIDSGSR